MSFRSALIAQFKKPSGFVGWLAGQAMAMRPSNKARNRWTLDLLEIEPTHRLLEIGCGPGFALALAAQKTPQGFVTGVDHSPTMIAMARRRLAGPLKRGRANLLIGDETQILAHRKNLNGVYSANVIQFIDDKAGYFKMAHDALVPGGRLAATYQPRGKNPSKEQAESLALECQRAMIDAGFKDARLHWLALPKIPAVCILAVA